MSAIQRIILATAALAMATGVAAASPVGGGSASVGVDEQRVDLDEGAGVAKGRASAETERVDLAARAPVCNVDIEGQSSGVDGCAGPEVDAEAAPPTLNVDVFVGLGRIEDAPPGGDLDTLEAATSASLMPVSPGTALAVTAAAGASAAALYAASRFLRFVGLAGLIPLYSQISDDRILDDPTRARIVSLVRDVPGVSTKDLAERLGLAWGTVTHHVTKLEKRRFIVSKKYGKYRRYFVNGAAPPSDDDAVFGIAPDAHGAPGWRDAVAVMRVQKTADVAAFIKSNPGFTQKDVGEALGVSSSTVLWHVKRLEAVGLVTKVRDGKTVRYFPPGTSVTVPPVPTPAGSA